MNGLFTSGIIVALIVGFWDKIKDRVWSFLNIFICHTLFDGGTLGTYGAKFIWDKLENKESLAPNFLFHFAGSGKDLRLLIREVGFRNLRLIFINKFPALVTINSELWCNIYSLKPFLTEKKILFAIQEYHKKMKLITTDTGYVNQYQFTCSYIRGTLNKNNEKKNDEQKKGSVPELLFSTFNIAEELDIGKRLNYTQEDFKNLVNLMNKDSTLFDNLYLTQSMVELKGKMERWYKNKSWFKDRNIQWKRGILLHGKPGTGKTSFISGLAEYLKMPVYIFDLSTFTNEDLDREWRELKGHTPCFVVFEDFDSVFDGRTNIYSNKMLNANPLSFDCILNILDGGIRFDGIATFITTNNIDKVDSALSGKNIGRPGRIDYVYEMGDIDDKGRFIIAEKMFKGMKNSEELIRFAIETNKSTTPAQFKEHCINIALETYEKE